MGLVVTLWAVQIAAVAVSLAGHNRQDVVATKLMRVLRHRAVWALLAFSFGFLYLALSADARGEGGAATLALVSFGLELAILVSVVRSLSREAGGIDLVFGSARFATAAHARAMGLLGSSGIRLGYTRPETRSDAREPIQYTGERHLLTIAPTRAGKGVSTIIPNLLTYKGSAIIIDPKGENAVITYDQRAKLGRAFALDPWRITGKPMARFNPLDLLYPESPTLIEDALLIADALIISDGSNHTKFWSDEARALIMGFLLHLATDPREVRTLGRLRDILTSTSKELAAVGSAMIRSRHPVVVSSAARLVSKTDTERSGILSTAQQNTHFLDSPALRDNLGTSDFRFGDLKGARPASVYIVLPVDRMGTYSRWLRLLTALGIADLSRNPSRPPQPVLFMLDEFAQLGSLSIIEDAFGLMAGMGIQLHAIVQDISQLERLYNRGWQTDVLP